MKASKSYSSRYQRDKIREYLKNEALILDVRGKSEWKTGHIPNSKHIPLNGLQVMLASLKAIDRPIITVCVSGIRSEQASRLLREHGINSINGGGWKNVAELLHT